MMSDCIFIRDLEIMTIIGTLLPEREEKQRLIFNVKIFTDFARPGQSDNLHDALDYSKVEAEIKHFVEHSSYQLLEKLGEETARLILKHPQVEKVTLKIAKPGAPQFARSIAIKLTRKKLNKTIEGTV